MAWNTMLRKHHFLRCDSSDTWSRTELNILSSSAMRIVTPTFAHKLNAISASVIASWMVLGTVAIHATTDTTIKFLLSDEKHNTYYLRIIVLVAIIAIFIDTIFGVWRSVKKNGWTSFKSRRLSDTLGKAALYSGGIVFTFLIERFIAGDIIAHFIAVELIMTKFVAFFCVIVEVKSINESYESVTGKNILAAMRKFVTRSKEELDAWK